MKSSRSSVYKLIVLVFAAILFMFTSVTINKTPLIKANAAENVTVELRNSSGGAVCKIDSNKTSCEQGKGKLTLKGNELEIENLQAPTNTLYLNGNVKVSFKADKQKDQEGNEQNGSNELEKIVVENNSSISLETVSSSLNLTNKRQNSKTNPELNEEASVITGQESSELELKKGEFNLSTERGNGILGFSKVKVSGAEAKLQIDGYYYGVKTKTFEATNGETNISAQERAALFTSDKIITEGESTTVNAQLVGQTDEKNKMAVVCAIETEKGIEASGGSTLIGGTDNLMGNRFSYGIASRGEIVAKSEEKAQTYVLGSAQIGITTLYPDVKNAKDIKSVGSKIEGVGKGSDGIQARNFEADENSKVIARGSGGVDLGTIGSLTIKESKLTTVSGLIGVHSSGNILFETADCSIAGEGDMLLGFANITISGVSNIRIVFPGEKDFDFGVNGIHAKEKIFLNFAEKGQATVKGLAKPEVGYGGAITAGGPTLAYHPFEYNKEKGQEWNRYQLDEKEQVVLVDSEDSQSKEPGIVLGKRTIIQEGQGKVSELSTPYHFKYAIVDDSNKPISSTAIYRPERPFFVTFMLDNWTPVLIVLLFLFLIVLLYFALRHKRALIVLGGAKNSEMDSVLSKRVADYSKQHHIWFKKTFLVAATDEKENSKKGHIRFLSNINEARKRHNFSVVEVENLIENSKSSAFAGNSFKYAKPGNKKANKKEGSLKDVFAKSRIGSVYLIGKEDEISFERTAEDIIKIIKPKNNKKPIVTILKELVDLDSKQKLKENRQEFKKQGIEIR